MSIRRTLRERKFIAAYIENNGNAAKAYRATHPKYDGENAKVLGCRMLTKVNLTQNELLNEMGMTDAYLNQKLNEGLEAKKVISVIPIKAKESQPNTTDLGDANSGSLEFLDVEDYPTRHKYLDTALKLKDKYPTEKKKVDLNVEGELEVNSKLDKKLSQLDIKDLKKIVKLNIKANEIKS